MAQLTLNTIEKIEMITGHFSLSSLVRTQLTSNFTQSVVDRVNEILAELVVVDEQLKEAVSMTFVTQSRESKLNYAVNLYHVKNEGNRILIELCNLLQIDLKYNKYFTSSKKNTKSYW